MAVIGSLSVKLGLVTVEWDKATKQAKEQAKSLQKSFEDLTGGVKKLQEGWKALGGSLSIGSLGMAAMIQQTLAFTDEITDLAKGYGTTISQTLAFRQALMQAGVSADGASKIMSSLFGKIDDAKKGNDTTIAQFEKLGISFKELKELSPYEAIQKVAQGFTNITDQFEKVKLIKELFGKAGVGVSLEDINAALEKGTDKFDKYAESIDKVGKINDNLKQSFDNLKIAFADLIAPLTRDKVTSAEHFSAVLKGMAAAFVVTQIAKLAVSIYEVSVALRAAAAAGAVFNMTAGGATPTGLLIKGGALLAGAATFMLSMPSAEQHPAVKKPAATSEEGYISEQTEARKENVEYNHEQAVANKQIEESVSKQAEALRLQISLNKTLMQFDVAKIQTAAQIQTMGETATKLALEDIQLKQKVAEIEAKRNAELNLNKEGSEALKASINGLADVEIKRAKANTAANKQAILQTAEYKALVDSMMANPSFQRMERMQQEATDAAAKAMKEADIAARYEHGKAADEQVRLNKLANERLEYENSLYLVTQQERDVLLQEYDLEAKITEFKYQQAKLGQDPKITEARVEDMRKVGNATIALNKQTVEQQRTFEYGWKTAYDNWVENTQNMAKIGASAFTSITDTMDAALTQFVRTGKVAFKDLIRDMIQNLLLLQMRTQMTTIFGGFLKNLFAGPSLNGPVPGGDWGGAYADGGSVPGGKVSLVGERGPELFVPRSSGTIIPNNQLAGMGSTTNVTNNYINAIDVKSFEERLMGSSRAIWAANTYAQKSLAIGTGRM